MQELLAELIEATKALRSAGGRASDMHKQYEAAECARAAAYDRLKDLKSRLAAEIRTAAGYSAEDVAELARYD